MWQRVKESPLGSIRAWRLVMYPLIGVLILVMFGLTLYEFYVNEAGPDVSAYIGVPADNGVLRIQPKASLWAPGSYIVDVPSGGMFDTSRVYYAFGVK